MPEYYKYELWNGKEVIGYCLLRTELAGKTYVITDLSMLKSPYGRKLKTITVPIITRMIFRDYQDYTFRICLDVRRKSKRQIAIIQSRGGSLGGSL